MFARQATGPCGILSQLASVYVHAISCFVGLRRPGAPLRTRLKIEVGPSVTGSQPLVVINVRLERVGVPAYGHLKKAMVDVTCFCA
ncbi:hypothetical protein BaRGS_00018902 [Batillaria attramentaria]|uniref:Secreted protein n=1 Tax=Batillaria attramentaria TaxID=370345 RepID=A0ABD0KSV0_9CAEN